jgi:3-hydroxyisobutyrate dehydrogenase
MANIGLLGLGAMGSRMATRLLEAGHTVKVYNRTTEKVKPLVAKGALPAATPKEAAQGAEIVISMVRDDDASKAVWLSENTGAIHGLSQDAIAVESSTLTNAWVQELAGQLKKAKAHFVDAPVVGSRPQAEAGQLIYLVGGSDEVVAKLQPVLSSMGGSVQHVGATGTGTTMKLTVNALFGIQLAALGELLGFVERAGVEAGKALEVLGATPVLSPAAKGGGTLMTNKQFAPMFPIELVEKDFGYVVKGANEVKSNMPMSSAARKVYQQAINQELGGENISAVVKLFKEK